MGKSSQRARSPAPKASAKTAPRRHWALALATVLCCAVLVSLLVERPEQLATPPAPARYLDDRAGLVSWQFAAAKNQYLEYLSRIVRIAQVNVVILPRSPVQDVEEFCVQAATAWKIGAAGADNGLALFVFRDDQKVRLEVGYGLESVITDAVAGRLLAQTLIPAFARGQFETGIEDFLETLNKTLEASEAADRRASHSIGMIPFVMTVLRNAPNIAHKVLRAFVDAEIQGRIVLSLFGFTLAGLAVYAVAGILPAVPAVAMLPWRLYTSPTLRNATRAGIAEQFAPRNFFARPPPIFAGLFEELQMGDIVNALYLLTAAVTGIAFLFVGSGLFMDGLGRFGGAGATLMWPAPAAPGG
ncbi:MAG: TPM domain-containing protein [Ramlibacter sp.]